MKQCEPDSTNTQIKRFVRAIYEPDDLVEVRLLPSGRQLWLLAHELAGRARELVRANRAGQNVYVGANPRKQHGGRREDVALARCRGRS